MMVQANDVIGHNGDIWQCRRRLQLVLRDAHIVHLRAGYIMVVIILRCAILSLELPFQRHLICFIRLPCLFLLIVIRRIALLAILSRAAIIIVVIIPLPFLGGRRA